MKRMIWGLSVAFVGVVALHAQDVKSRTEIKADDAKAVVYTGCLATGTESKSFVLENESDYISIGHYAFEPFALTGAAHE